MPKNEEVETRAVLHESLNRLAQKLTESKSLRPGDIVFRLSGQGDANYCLDCSKSRVRVVDSAGAGADRQPLIEVIGDAQSVRTVIDGERDARKEFLAGGFRIRGDLRYVSDLFLEVGLLKEPL